MHIAVRQLISVTETPRTDTPQTETPMDRDPHGQRPPGHPWTEIHWTETPGVLIFHVNSKKLGVKEPQKVKFE